MKKRIGIPNELMLPLVTLILQCAILACQTILLLTR